MIKIGLIYGGRSTEHDASLKSYDTFIKNLDINEIQVIQTVFISREGEVYINNNKSSFEKLCESVENEQIFYFNLLHGQEGEDGCWSGMAEILSMKGSFESVLTSAILMDKYFQSAIVIANMENKLSIPKTKCIRKLHFVEEVLLEKLNEISSEKIIVKPNSMGASHYTKCFKKDELKEIYNFISAIFEFDNTVLIQEFIEGKEYTCGVFAKFLEPVSLPVITVSTLSGVLGHYEKHTAGNAEVSFENSIITKNLQKISEELFSLFRVVGMCRFDFIVTNEKIYFLEGNLLPGFSLGSAFPKMLKQAEITLTEFVKCLIKSYNLDTRKNKFLPYTIEENDEGKDD